MQHVVVQLGGKNLFKRLEIGLQFKRVKRAFRFLLKILNLISYFFKFGNRIGWLGPTLVAPCRATQSNDNRVNERASATPPNDISLCFEPLNKSIVAVCCFAALNGFWSNQTEANPPTSTSLIIKIKSV